MNLFGIFGEYPTWDFQDSVQYLDSLIKKLNLMRILCDIAEGILHFVAKTAGKSRLRLMRPTREDGIDHQTQVKKQLILGKNLVKL